MARTAFLRVLFALILAIAFSSVSAQTASAQASSAPAMGVVPAAPGGTTRMRIRTPPSLPAPTKNTYEILSADKDASKFMALVDRADMKDLLAGSPGSVITVFAPTNAAMENIPESAMKRIEASKASMQSFVEYHVIANTIVSGSALKGRKSSPASVSGETLNFDGTDRSQPPKVNDGSIVGADISATNGVIHVISSAAVPPSMLALPKPVLQAAPPPVPPSAPVAAKTPVTPTVPAAPAAPQVSTGVNSTTTGSAGIDATATGSMMNDMMTGSAVQSTTTAETPPAQTTTTPDSGDKGITVFGHKFGW